MNKNLWPILQRIIVPGSYTHLIPAQEKCVYENLNLFWNALEKGLVKLVSVIFTKDARLTQRIPQSCMLPLIASIMGRFSFLIGLTIGT